MNSEQYQILEGLLLSDGCVSARNNSCKYHSYQQTCKEPLFLKWAQKSLPTESTISGPHAINNKEYNKIYYYYLLRTPTNKVYTEIRHRWYPNGKKIVPDTFKVTPQSMLAEYLGDGNLGKWNIQLATCGFEINDTQKIVTQLIPLGFNCTVNTKNSIIIRQSSVLNFLKYIGPCPVKSMEYKWDFDIKRGSNLRQQHNHKIFKFIAPDGGKHFVGNLTQFCKRHNLTRGMMTEVYWGDREYCKGWSKAI